MPFLYGGEVGGDENNWYECDISFDEQGVPFFSNPRPLYDQARANVHAHQDSYHWRYQESSYHDGTRLNYPNAIDVESWVDEQRDHAEEAFNRQLMRET